LVDGWYGIEVIYRYRAVISITGEAVIAMVAVIAKISFKFFMMLCLDSSSRYLCCLQR